MNEQDKYFKGIGSVKGMRLFHAQFEWRAFWRPLAAQWRGVYRKVSQ
jgi:hypothetical protein